MSETNRTDLKLSIVVAVGPNNVIGKGGNMPWDLRSVPSDAQRFKAITMKTGVVVMGRKTHESILRVLHHTLRDRRSIVLTHSTAALSGVEVAPSLEAACALVRAHGGRACVIGGAEVYRAFLPLVSCIKMTHVEVPGAVGDTFFPTLDPLEWSCLQYFPPKRYDRDQYTTSFEVFERA